MTRTLFVTALLATAWAHVVSAPVVAVQAAGTQLQIILTLGRKAYQTNERIDLAVVRGAPAALKATELTLNLTGPDGSQMTFTFPLPATPIRGNEARQTEHLHLNARLLRPGNYTIEVAADGATAKADFELYSHIRKSSFRLVDWASRAKGAEQAALGDASLGFNMVYASYGGLSADDLIRGGLDYMWCCTMSGGHQMDLRLECDWSDPYVLDGGTARVVRRAFQDRTNPNCVGVHFYDEPGLTWHKHPQTGEFGPHNVPAQDRAYQRAFGRDMVQYHLLKPDNVGDVARWLEWGRWKQSLMEAAWRYAAFGVAQVRPDFLSVTQSVYGWSAFTDGYYFNIARGLPVINGHGGYDDMTGGYMHPSFAFEFGRMRDLAVRAGSPRPYWYLPTWYGGMPANRFRLEQYLSFMNNLQGMMKPPDMQVHQPIRLAPQTTAGVIESNQLMARLGTIFTTMPVTRPPVAVLYSLSHNLKHQTRDMKDNYEGGGHGRKKTLLVYLAGKLAHEPVFPIVEEDILDGTLAAHHKAVVLPGIDYLDPKVITALEAFAASGGTVIVSDESKVEIKGAIKLGVPLDVTLFDRLGQLWTEQKIAEFQRLSSAGSLFKAAEPVAKALKVHLDKLGIRPAIKCNNSGIVISRQAHGDIEYLFAVNASYDEGIGQQNSIQAAEAALSLPADGRPIYDAVHGGKASAFKPEDPKVVAPAQDGAWHAAGIRFGPGQMRVFARTARPIGSIHALKPTVYRDYTVTRDPLGVEISAALSDTTGRPLCGSAPLHIKVIDPLGVTRYDLYRATERGTFQMKLPLAANDPAGEWKVEVKELLSNTADVATFAYTPPVQCGAVAGATARAISFGNDRENIFRFFRSHKDVTIVSPTDTHPAAIERLQEGLKPWGVRCKLVNAADVKPRELTEEEAKTWCGLEYAASGQIKPGKGNNPLHVGFDLRGPAILLGTPEDNPLIGFLKTAKFLPYTPDPQNFPGRGRGMIAWQRDGISYGHESITLIAHDADGMAEAVGSLYESATGLKPLTPLVLPSSNSITAANKAPTKVPELETRWTARFPDRAVALKPLPNEGLVVLSQDGTLAVQNPKGTVWQKTIPGGEVWALDATPEGGLIVIGASQHLVGFDGKGNELFDIATTEDKPAAVVTFVAVSPDGKQVAAGGDNGKLTLFDAKGKRLWTVGGVDPKDKNAKSNPYLSAAFTGETLVALTGTEAQVLSLADGKMMTRVGGANGWITPTRLGDNLLVSDSRSVQIITATGKATKLADLPDAGIAALAISGRQVVIGGETDGSLRGLGPAPGPPAWEHQTSRRIVKQLAARDGLIAAAYWGGLVHVLDKDGKLKAGRRFPQDVAAIAWTGERLVVALADGQVVAVEMK